MLNGLAEFKVAAISRTTSMFGARGYIVVDRNGVTFEVVVNLSSTLRTPKLFEVITLNFRNGRIVMMSAYGGVYEHRRLPDQKKESSQRFWKVEVGTTIPGYETAKPQARKSEFSGFGSWNTTPPPQPAPNPFGGRTSSFYEESASGFGTSDFAAFMRAAKAKSDEEARKRQEEERKRQEEDARRRQADWERRQKENEERKKKAAEAEQAQRDREERVRWERMGRQPDKDKEDEAWEAFFHAACDEDDDVEFDSEAEERIFNLFKGMYAQKAKAQKHQEIKERIQQLQREVLRPNLTEAQRRIYRSELDSLYQKLEND